MAAFYSFHVIEHLPDDYLPSLFSELFRCLVPGGWVRLGGPDAENASRKFIEGDAAWFGEFPDKRNSLGGRFANFLLCRGEHLTLLSESYLAELLSFSGFVQIRRCLPGKESGFQCDEILRQEYEDDFRMPHSIVVEAIRPKQLFSIARKIETEVS